MSKPSAEPNHSSSHSKYRYREQGCWTRYRWQYYVAAIVCFIVGMGFMLGWIYSKKECPSWTDNFGVKTGRRVTTTRKPGKGMHSTRAPIQDLMPDDYGVDDEEKNEEFAAMRTRGPKIWGNDLVSLDLVIEFDGFYTRKIIPNTTEIRLELNLLEPENRLVLDQEIPLPMSIQRSTRSHPSPPKGPDSRIFLLVDKTYKGLAIPVTVPLFSLKDAVDLGEWRLRVKMKFLDWKMQDYAEPLSTGVIKVSMGEIRLLSIMKQISEIKFAHPDDETFTAAILRVRISDLHGRMSPPWVQDSKIEAIDSVPDRLTPSATSSGS